MKLYNSLKNFSQLSNKRAFLIKLLLNIVAFIFIGIATFGILGMIVGFVAKESWVIFYIIWSVIAILPAIVLKQKANRIPYENIAIDRCGQHTTTQNSNFIFNSQLHQTHSQQSRTITNNIFHNQISGWYDMDTLEGINAIPVPAINYKTGEPTKDCIYYLLQRKATEHKKKGRMDLAIACLKKSNDLSDYEQHSPLLLKDYMRLVKYLEANGQTDIAQIELDHIRSRHPEFFDTRIKNKKSIQQTLNKCRQYNVDVVSIKTNHTCPICKKFNGKKYSISGNNHNYPKLPIEFIQYGGFDKTCHVSILIDFDI